MTLIELLIAMSLGVVLLGGVIQVLSSSQQMFRSQTALSGIQETGRFAIERMSHTIIESKFELTGNTENDELLSEGIKSCDSTKTCNPLNYSLPSLLVLNPPANLLNNISGSPSDAVSVVFEHLSDSNFDCHSAAPTTKFARNTFFIAPNPNNLDSQGNPKPTLFCDSSAGGTQPLVENVINMQILYGLDEGMIDPVSGSFDNTKFDGRPERYFTDLTNTNGADPSRVSAIKISLLVQADISTRTSDDLGIVTQNNGVIDYELAGENIETKSDNKLKRRLKRTFQTTIKIRNSIN
ncbi:MAG: hypothetical protein HOM11_00910 [Methylococcales bacterium]|nr:hypothetical protein [Methylococcales bacterium]MBT7442379.1 hypothetical protein [Methylococcales bacterium]